MDFGDFLFWRKFAFCPRSRDSEVAADLLRSYRQFRRQCPTLSRGEVLAWLQAKFGGGQEEDSPWSGLREKCQLWKSLGYQLFLPDDPRFPSRLKTISDPPRGLFYWGAAEALERPALAVVGSREPSDWGISWVEKELSLFLRRQPRIQIVSGGARGVDQLAHRASLMQGRSTLVFLPSGFDQIYPAQLKHWVAPLQRAGGGFLSEYSPDQSMRKAYFAERNRLISGISHAVLAVEARRRSGTLLTTRAAADQGRAVFVVPGHPYDERAQGSLDLLGEGATMVRDAQELSAFFQAEVISEDFNSSLLSTNRENDPFDH